MRFFLDEDVNAAVGQFLRRRRHQCWTTAQAGRSGAKDDDQSVYADDKDAVLVSHDLELLARRRRRVIGRHVALCCEQPDGVELLDTWIELIEPVLESLKHVTIELRWNGYQVHRGWA